MHQQNTIEPKLSHLRQQLLSLLESASQSTNQPSTEPAQTATLDRSHTLNEVIKRLGTTNEIVAQGKKPNALSDVLTQLEDTLGSVPQPYQDMISSVVDLGDDLPWYQRAVANNCEFMAGHINAQIIGPEGLEVRQDLIVGVTLMRPDLDYPDHQHEPEELYLVLSEGRWRQASGAWHTPGLGGLVYNPSDVMHGMKSLAVPLIALWCLPLDKPFVPFSTPITS